VDITGAAWLAEDFMLFHLSESELLDQAAIYRRRAADVRTRALETLSRVAQSSLLIAAQTWERLAEAREIEANARRNRHSAAGDW
jgi:hypothetical protein